MSTLTLPGPASGAVVPLPAVRRVLALAEARRLLLHPVMLVGWSLWAVLIADTLIRSPRALDAFEAVGSSLSWSPGVPAMLAAYLVATRDRRAGTLDVLDASPARVEERVRALCLAALGPALVGLVLNGAVLGALLLQDKLVEAPSAGHVLLPPLTLLGACLLGTMLAVWVPSAVTPAVAIVAMVAVHVALEGSTAALFGPAVFWADWGNGDGVLWVGFVPGSEWWHLLYVAGLCGMAAAAAVVKVAEHRRAAVVVGLVSVVATVVGGLLQLP